MINFSFGGIGGDFLELTIELTIGDQIVQNHKMQMPYQMMMAQCQELVNQVANDTRPMKVVMRGEKEIELPNGDVVSKPSRLIYANKAYTNNFNIEDE